MINRIVLNLQNGLFRICGHSGIAVFDLAPHHVCDDFILREIGRFLGSDRFSVAENRDRIGNIKHFSELVGDVDAGDAPLPEFF